MASGDIIVVSEAIIGDSELIIVPRLPVRLLEILELLVQQGDLLVAYSPITLDHPCGNARAGDQHLAGAIQTLAAQLDREGRALLAAGGIDKADIRPLLRVSRGRPRSKSDRPR